MRGEWGVWKWPWAAATRIKFRQDLRRGLLLPLARAPARCGFPAACRLVPCRLAPCSLAPRRLAPPPLEHAASDMAPEQLLPRIAQPPHRRGEGEPLDRHDVLHDVAARPLVSLHAPELHDLRPAARAIDDGAEKFVHLHAMTGLFHHFAAGATGRILAALEFAARQHPALVLAALDDGNAPVCAVAHHDASRRLNGLARHCCSA